MPSATPPDPADSGLSHVAASGAVQMVDVGGKEVTRRRASAVGVFRTTADVIALLVADDLPKSDALATVRVGAIMAAKRTAEIIPLCHPLPLDSVSVDLDPHDDTVDIRAVATTTGRTGVEMEALTAVHAAGLILHDMVKAVDPRAVVENIHLEAKSGGKRGDWTF